MGDTWVPDDIFDMKPLIRNFFENTSTVQVISLYLDHIKMFSFVESYNASMTVLHVNITL